MFRFSHDQAPKNVTVRFQTFWQEWGEAFVRGDGDEGLGTADHVDAYLEAFGDEDDLFLDELPPGEDIKKNAENYDLLNLLEDRAKLCSEFQAACDNPESSDLAVDGEFSEKLANCDDDVLPDDDVAGTARAHEVFFATRPLLMPGEILAAARTDFKPDPSLNAKQRQLLKISTILPYIENSNKVVRKQIGILSLSQIWNKTALNEANQQRHELAMSGARNLTSGQRQQRNDSWKKTSFQMASAAEDQFGKDNSSQLGFVRFFGGMSFR